MDAQLGDLLLIEVERQLSADNHRDLGALAGAARRARCALTRPLAERERRQANEAAPLSLSGSRFTRTVWSSTETAAPASRQTAWREQKNEDVAATIIGYIRQLALGSPLLPYAERVDHAIGRLRKAHRFTDSQADWLERIGDQVKIETVVDRKALDRGQFQAKGGFARLNKVFDGKLEAVLGELAEEVWKDAG